MTKQNLLQTPLSVLLEYPFDWNKDPNPCHKIFLDNLIQTITNQSKPLSIVSAPWPTHGIDRIPLKNTLIIAFHSYQNPQNVWTIKESPIYGLYTIDQSGYSGWSHIAQHPYLYLKKINKIDIDDARKIIDSYRISLLSGFSKYKQPAKASILPTDYYLFPLQVRTDSVAKLAYLDSLDVLDQLDTLSQKYKKYIIVKRHPWCQSIAVQTKLNILQKENPYIIVSNTDINHLIQHAKAVISCNSGTSFEALICNKPVFTFGASEWEFATQSLHHLHDVEKLFLEIPSLSIEQEKFIAYLLSEYWVHHQDVDAINLKFQQMCKSFDQTIGANIPTQQALNECLEEHLLSYQQKYTKQVLKVNEIETDYKHLKKSFQSIQNNPIYALIIFIKNLLKIIQKK